MRRKNNTVIAILITGILIMSVGYAALVQRLSILGTANIASTWGVEIIGITSKATGEASNVLNTPTFTATTATFNTNLVNPGDKMEYTVTVKNTGTLDAIIESVNLEHDENPAINYMMDGINRGYTLTSNETIDLKLTVEFDINTTKQPDNISSNATLIINAVQLHNSNITPVEKPKKDSFNTLVQNVVTTGDGLYADPYEEGRYIYKGSNPDNYIDFNNETWRILSLENDGSIKIVRDNSIGNMKFDESGVRSDSSNTYCSSTTNTGLTVGGVKIYSECNAWSSTSSLNSNPSVFTQYAPFGNSSNTINTFSGTVSSDAKLNTYLNNTYYNTLGIDKVYITNHDFNVSTPGNGTDNEDMLTNINQEKDYVWNGMVGLITVTEYMRATTNSACIALNSYETCGTNNWLAKYTNAWTISPYVSSSTSPIIDNGLNVPSGTAFNITGDVAGGISVASGGTVNVGGSITETGVVNVESGGTLIVKGAILGEVNVAHGGILTVEGEIKSAINFADANGVWYINENGKLSTDYLYNGSGNQVKKVVPVVYLTPNINLTGTGSSSDHFQIVK